jgi:hypothetical protein
MLQGYIDDSGSHDENLFVLAGYVLPAEQWATFSDQWSICLRKEPQIRCFKMADAEYGDGYFTGMREEFRRLKIRELSEVITAHKPMGLSCSLRWDDYKRILRGRIPSDMDNPYVLLFWGILRLMHEWQRHLGGYHKVDFDFDEQGADAIQAVKWYPEIKARVPEPYKSMLGRTPTFLDDEEVVPLQAADMLAWHVRRLKEFPDESRPVFKTITENYTPFYVEPDFMEDFIRGFTSPPPSLSV